MISFSDKAVEKVQEFAAQMPEAEGKELRIFIQGVGCSGFAYGFTFDEERDGDSVVESGDLKVLVDPNSAPHLTGSTVDFIEDQVELEARDTEILPDEELEQNETQRHISEIMTKIPEHYREPFVLREVHDLSYAEIAAATGLKMGTVRSRINRARAHFRAHWVARFRGTDESA